VIWIALLCHVCGLLWLLGDWDRIRLLAMDIREVPSDAFLTNAPDALIPLGYTEDPPASLAAFRRLAAPLIADARSDGEKARRLGDFIYGLRRPGRPDATGDVRQGLASLIRKLEDGDAGSCGHMSAVMAALWRSMGGHTRGVRWATVAGHERHDGVELYSSSAKRWMYYDLNLNGYGADENGQPLSLASLHSSLLTGEDVHLVANPVQHEWTGEELMAAVRESPVAWYVLNNDLTGLEPAVRFGRAGVAFPWLVSVPWPLDRALDNLAGHRDRRLIVAGRAQIGGLFSVHGGQLACAYLVAIIVLCTAGLWVPMAETRAA
jgi:hypothetical protein